MIPLLFGFFKHRQLVLITRQQSANQLTQLGLEKARHWHTARLSGENGKSEKGGPESNKHQLWALMKSAKRPTNWWKVNEDEDEDDRPGAVSKLLKLQNVLESGLLWLLHLEFSFVTAIAEFIFARRGFQPYELPTPSSSPAHLHLHLQTHTFPWPRDLTIRLRVTFTNFEWPPKVG